MSSSALSKSQRRRMRAKQNARNNPKHPTKNGTSVVDKKNDRARQPLSLLTIGDDLLAAIFDYLFEATIFLTQSLSWASHKVVTTYFERPRYLYIRKSSDVARLINRCPRVRGFLRVSFKELKVENSIKAVQIIVEEGGPFEAPTDRCRYDYIGGHNQTRMKRFWNYEHFACLFTTRHLTTLSVNVSNSPFRELNCEDFPALTSLTAHFWHLDDHCRTPKDSFAWFNIHKWTRLSSLVLRNLEKAQRPVLNEEDVVRLLRFRNLQRLDLDGFDFSREESSPLFTLLRGLPPRFKRLKLDYRSFSVKNYTAFAAHQSTFIENVTRIRACTFEADDVALGASLSGRQGSAGVYLKF